MKWHEADGEYRALSVWHDDGDHFQWVVSPTAKGGFTIGNSTWELKDFVCVHQKTETPQLDFESADEAMRVCEDVERASRPSRADVPKERSA